MQWCKVEVLVGGIGPRGYEDGERTDGRGIALGGVEIPRVGGVQFVGCGRGLCEERKAQDFGDDEVLAARVCASQCDNLSREEVVGAHFVQCQGYSLSRPPSSRALEHHGRNVQFSFAGVGAYAPDGYDLGRRLVGRIPEGAVL